jgi:hypothetical protein
MREPQEVLTSTEFEGWTSGRGGRKGVREVWTSIKGRSQKRSHAWFPWITIGQQSQKISAGR